MSLEHWYPPATFLLTLAIVGLVSGCNDSQPKAPTVSVGKRQVDTTEDQLARIKFPAGYPSSVSLYQPTWIGEQDDAESLITWNTDADLIETRDFYFDKFQELGLEPILLEINNQPGENWNVRFYDQDSGTAFNTAMGKQQVEGGVTCFIYTQKLSATEWKTAE